MTLSHLHQVKHCSMGLSIWGDGIHTLSSRGHMDGAPPPCEVSPIATATYLRLITRVEAVVMINLMANPMTSTLQSCATDTAQGPHVDVLHMDTSGIC
jgi:hypothetical protein